MSLEGAMDDYRRKFDDNFPLMCCMGMSEEEIIEEIYECIENDRPFEYVDGVDY